MSFAPKCLHCLVNLGQVCYQLEKTLKHNFDGKRLWIDLLPYCCNTTAGQGSKPRRGGGCGRERQWLSFGARDLTITQELMNGYRQAGRQKEIWVTGRVFQQTSGLTLKDFIDLMSKENFKDNEDSFTDTYSWLGKKHKDAWVSVLTSRRQGLLSWRDWRAELVSWYLMKDKNWIIKNLEREGSVWCDGEGGPEA